MNKSKLLVVLLAIALVISAGANAYFAAYLSSVDNGDSVKVEMNKTLSAVEVKVDAEIERIGNSVIYASQQLTQTGISGDQARAVISALVANSSFIVEGATQNLDRKMMVVEPDAWHTSEGKIIGAQKWLNPNPVGDITPCMTPVIMLITNMSGCSIVAPVFNSNKVMVGTVSSIFSPQKLINASISAVAAESPYAFSAIQADGLVVYSENANFRDKNIFTDPSLASYTGIIQMGQQAVKESSGYATYPVGDRQSECYWTTINAYGQEWRLIIHRAT